MNSLFFREGSNTRSTKPSRNYCNAVFHLVEELAFLEDVCRLPDSDRAQLAGDMRRTCNHMDHQWLDCMRHQKEHYPYLFSLVMRTNLFDHEASPVIEQVQEATYPTM